jgi:hypothetical protein
MVVIHWNHEARGGGGAGNSVLAGRSAESMARKRRS